MQLIKQGAEAKLFETKYLGKKAVLKQREKKRYRNRNLDERILNERIKTECSLLLSAQKAGIRTPLILDVQPENSAIILEFISGKTLKEELFGKGNKDLYTKAGKEIAKLHSKGIIHGDLTTSNIMLYNSSLVFLDFGLGKRAKKLEDYAVDLLTFKKTFKATHFEILEKWKEIEKAYCKGFSSGEDVLKQISKIEARARYS